MKIEVCDNSKEMARFAADIACETLKTVIRNKGSATFISATGSAQFEFLEILSADRTIDWQKTTMFHLDEYVGISEEHPASFRKYLQERLVDKVHPGRAFLIEGNASDPEIEIKRLSDLISKHTIDIAFIGIGENSHVAFNDPPADFNTGEQFKIVELDEKCRQQQVNEGWFETIESVPKRAITMTVKQILMAKKIVCIVPGIRKAEAVKNCFKDEKISPMFPASILKKHPNTIVFLDKESASLLRPDI